MNTSPVVGAVVNGVTVANVPDVFVEMYPHSTPPVASTFKTATP